MPATKTNLKVSAISYVILYVKDTQKALDFYRDTLGAKVKASTDGWVELDMGQTTLALHHERDDSEASGSGSATVVFNTDHIDQTYETLKNAGVKLKGAPHTVFETPDQIGRSLEFEDNDGNLLSFFGMQSKK